MPTEVGSQPCCTRRTHWTASAAAAGGSAGTGAAAEGAACAAGATPRSATRKTAASARKMPGSADSASAFAG